MPITTIPATMFGNTQLNPNGMTLGVPIIENSQAINTSYCISTGTNAVSAGPITIASGVILTVPVGSVWKVI
jgi:hypothetical protein